MKMYIQILRKLGKGKRRSLYSVNNRVWSCFLGFKSWFSLSLYMSHFNNDNKSNCTEMYEDKRCKAATHAQKILATVLLNMSQHWIRLYFPHWIRLYGLFDYSQKSCVTYLFPNGIKQQIRLSLPSSQVRGTVFLRMGK